MTITRYVTYPDLPNYGVAFSRKHLLDMQREGKFPRARQLSANRVAWLETEILAWINEPRPVARSVAGTPDSPRLRRGPRAGGEATK